MPSLNQERYRSGSLMSQNNKYLYCFQGCDQNGSTLNNFERLDLSEKYLSEWSETSMDENRWEIFDIQELEIYDILKKNFILFEIHRLSNCS